MIDSSPTTLDIQLRISKIYDHMYANSSVRTPMGICDEVGKVLHIGMYLEEVEKVVPAFNISRSESKRILNSEDPYVQEVAKQMRQHFLKMNAKWALYPTDTTVTISDSDILFICNQLSDLVISDKARDIFGDALEIFRGVWAKRAGGQFFTDTLVTHLAIRLLNFNPLAGEKMIDPASGTGGFLLAGINRIRTLLEIGNGPGSQEDKLVKLARNSVFGIEVDKEVCAAANATLTARIGQTATPLVQNADSLRECFNDAENRLPAMGSMDCVAANPPFGTKITIKDPSILRYYELARATGYSGKLGPEFERTSPKAPDLLFLELCVKLLKPGTGRLAIILPYQILSGPQMAPIRAWLLKQVELIAVVDLPVETFQPHTGTRTALVVARRRDEPIIDLSTIEDKPFFMSVPQWIGHDRRGNPIYSKDALGRDTGEILSDFDKVEEAFNEFQAGGNPSIVHSQSFAIDFSAITADPQLRINAMYHQPSMDGNVSLIDDTAGGDWTFVRLGDEVERVFFPTRFKRAYIDRVQTAVPFLGGTNITQWMHNADKWLRADDKNLKQLTVRPGWILVTRSGTTGIVSTVPQAWDGVAMSEHIIRIIPKPGGLSPYYIESFLRTRYGQETLARGVFGSVIPEITPEYIEDMKIPIPRSKALLQTIIDSVERAQTARQESIALMNDALMTLENKLTEAIELTTQA